MGLARLGFMLASGREATGDNTQGGRERSAAENRSWIVTYYRYAIAFEPSLTHYAIIIYLNLSIPKSLPPCRSLARSNCSGIRNR